MIQVREGGRERERGREIGREERRSLNYCRCCLIFLQDHVLYSFSVPVACLQSAVQDKVQVWLDAIQRGAEDISLVATVTKKSVLLPTVAL